MLNWCVVGSGDVVQRLMKDSINIKNKSQIKCIISKNKSEAEKYSKKIGNIKFYNSNSSNIKKICEDNNINSVYIATPPNTHFSYISKFCKFKKNIVCEKPLIINKKEYDKLKTLTKLYKFNLLTCFYRRYLDRFLYIKKIINKGYLGKILYFEIKYFHNEKNHPTANIARGKKIPWRFNKKVSGGGNIVDMGIHAIDLINFFIGNVKSVSAIKKNQIKLYNVEDISVVNFELENNVIGHGSWCSTAPFKEDLFIIYGRKGTVSFTMNYGEKDDVVIKLKNRVFKKKIKMKTPLHKNMFKKFIDDLIFYNEKKIYKIDENGFKNSKILFNILNINT